MKKKNPFSGALLNIETTRSEVIEKLKKLHEDLAITQNTLVCLNNLLKKTLQKNEELKEKFYKHTPLASGAIFYYRISLDKNIEEVDSIKSKIVENDEKMKEIELKISEVSLELSILKEKEKILIEKSEKLFAEEKLKVEEKEMEEISEMVTLKRNLKNENT